MGVAASSTTSWPTSTSWSTSDLVRLTHPFPSLLDGAATAGIALLLGGTPALAALLGVAMVALQASIGVLNDLFDAPRDAGRADKPIAAGRIATRTGWRLMVAAATAGLGLSAIAGLWALAVGAAILAVGFAYDLWFKGTAWSWLPFAVGIPLLPVYAAVGSGGVLPPGFAFLVVAAGLAGAMLAVGNALADVEHDRAAGVASVATRLGRGRSLVTQIVLFAAVCALALVGLPVGQPEGFATIGRSVLVAGGTAVFAGLLLGARGAGSGRLAWGIQAIGVAAMAVGWLAATVA
jgi:4-hydroxybenzoate polyprenyltransferase